MTHIYQRIRSAVLLSERDSLKKEDGKLGVSGDIMTTISSVDLWGSESIKQRDSYKSRDLVYPLEVL